MEAFAAACGNVLPRPRPIPGVVPEALLAQDAESNDGIPRISSLENALYHLMGGYHIIANIRLRPVQWIRNVLWQREQRDHGEVRDQFRTAWRWTTHWWTPISLLLHSPPEGTLVKAFGQVGDPNLLDVVDAWGQPLALLRRQRTVGVLPNNRSGNDGNPGHLAIPHRRRSHPTLKLASAVSVSFKATSFLEQRPHMHLVNQRKHCFL